MADEVSRPVSHGHPAAMGAERHALMKATCASGAALAIRAPIASDAFRAL